MNNEQYNAFIKGINPALESTHWYLMQLRERRFVRFYTLFKLLHQFILKLDGVIGASFFLLLVQNFQYYYLLVPSFL
jgi:hypothetical protein